MTCCNTMIIQLYVKTVTQLNGQRLGDKILPDPTQFAASNCLHIIQRRELTCLSCKAHRKATCAAEALCFFAMPRTVG